MTHRRSSSGSRGVQQIRFSIGKPGIADPDLHWLGNASRRSKSVEVVEAGSAHTRGDAYIYVAEDRVVFTGDLLVTNAHPIVWRGPVANSVTAIRKLLLLDVDTVVPGHGPVTDKSRLEQTLAYLELLTTEARRRYDAGMPVEEAIEDIVLDHYCGWLDAECVYVNIRQGENGDIVLMAPAPDELRELARFTVMDAKIWNTPALAGRYLLVRNDGKRRSSRCLW